jgi:hypothetical protein
MKSLEENQTELFTKWQSETSELKGQLDKARANEKTTKEKIRRASLSVEKVRMIRTFCFGRGERAEMILTYLSLRSSQVKEKTNKKKGKARKFFDGLWSRHKHGDIVAQDMAAPPPAAQSVEAVEPHKKKRLSSLVAQRDSVILSQDPTRVRVASSSKAIMSEMVRTEKMQAEEWKELQVRQERLTVTLQKAQDDFVHKQVLETMQDLEATQQKLYTEWEKKNKDLQAQLEGEIGL